MHALSYVGRQALLAAILSAAAIQTEPAFAQSSARSEGANEVRIVELQGTVEVLPKGASTWVKTQTNQVLYPFDRLRTRANSRVTLRWSAQSVVPLGALTEIEILPHPPEDEPGLHLLAGIGSFFHRDKPGRIRIITHGVVAGVEGTEFVIQVDNSDQTTLWLIDGRVRFTTADHSEEVVMTNGQTVVAAPGKPLVVTAGFIVNNILQWCFYYPAVLDLRDLPLASADSQAIEASLAAYRSGDLLRALAKYPEGRQPASDAERVYYAALLLSVGQVEQSENTLATLSGTNSADRVLRLATALRQLVAAVKLQATPLATQTRAATGQLSTELLAGSYYEQSLAVRDISLTAALNLARQAATNSPDFGFAWARVAELEFSFGRTEKALTALNKSLAMAPRNAEAIALKGFLLAAKNKTGEAIDSFNDALAIDSALGNAWLGRGLCRIRRGDLAGGREDLLVAASLEPQRAFIRSYLGKAYAEARDYPHAAKELELAKRLDKNDPTAWLYSALLNQQRNQINQAIRDLEHSEDLNDNRSVYRSSQLLDQDRAVRSANLAAIYSDAGMFDVSVREASRAVNYDYANYSAHLFLANSYNELADPNRINLRYETPAEAEYLLANLLAPVGAGILSPAISQQEYSKLFERDRLGLYSSTEYLSRGAWSQSAAQYGTFGNFSYDLEAFYHTDPGQRPNNDFDERQFSLQLKQQLTLRDSLFFEGTLYDASGGDRIEYYDQGSANLGLRTQEKQEPIVSLGYHHESAPGLHTLLFASRLNDHISLSNPTQQTFLVDRTSGGLDYVEPMSINQSYQSRLNIYSIEAQQIWQTLSHNTIIGTRFQTGGFDTHDLQTNPSPNVVAFVAPTNTQSFETDFERLSFYGYHHWRIFEPLLLIGGLSYDHITFPENFRAAPISNRKETVDQVSPKGGLIWTPCTNTTLRAAYTRSLSGASIDQSFQLEPSQVAGFNQSFRSIIPESIGGAEAGARFETYGFSLEHQFPTATYLGLSGEVLNSTVDRTFGVFEINLSSFANPGGIREHIDYEEQTLLFTVNQLVGKQWSFGAIYRLSKADLKDDFVEVIPNLPPGSLIPPFRPHQDLSATLHHADLYAIWNHRSGFFAQLHGLWYSQSNRGYQPGIGGDDFWQLNAFVGYRWPGRRAELTLGLLNLTDQNYRLNPLNLYNELPRERTFAARFVFSF